MSESSFATSDGSDERVLFPVPSNKAAISEITIPGMGPGQQFIRSGVPRQGMQRQEDGEDETVCFFLIASYTLYVLTVADFVIRSFSSFERDVFL